MKENHPNIKYGKTGILLINLGTPDSTSWWDIRKYLKEFLSDKRVIEVNPVLWQILLNLFILNFRPSKTAHAYKKIWFKKTNESPLRYYTRHQTQKLKQKIKSENVLIDFAMRYGNPSIKSKLKQLKKAGCENIIILPLYPQYSAATTATVNDKVFAELSKMRWQPAIRTLPPFYDNNEYIDKLNKSINQHLGTLKWEPDRILTSYHGLPRRYLDLGDPYHCHCHKTTRLLKEMNKKYSKKIMLSFQSRFGREEWLKPYTEETVIKFANNGVKKLAILSPAFFSDCVETLEELNIGIQEVFTENGGEEFTLIPCLNDSQDGINLLDHLIKNELQGWV